MPHVCATIDLTRPQAHAWVEALLSLAAITATQARQMTRGLRVGDVLVYADWTTGRVEVTVRR